MQIRLFFPGLVALLILCHGCSGSGAGDPPIHLGLVCRGADGGDAVSCGVSERLQALDTWLDQEALFRPHSSFTVWAAGPDRQHYYPYFIARVPVSWGTGVMEAKARYLQTVRKGVEQGGTVPEGSIPPGPEAPGIHRLQVSTGAVGASSMRPGVWQALASGPAVGLLHMTVICDRSNSTMGVACNEAGLFGAFDRWIADGLAAAGSSFSIYVPGPSRDTVRSVYTLFVPERPAGERAAFLLSARRELGRLLTGPLEKNSSALAEAIHLAIGEIGERKGGHRLVILSDLRQFTPGTWNFERSVPSSQRFVTWLRGERLLADLKGIPVTVCGLHHLRGPGAEHYDAQLSAQTRDTWEGAFRAMGATEIGMFATYEAAFASRQS